ncbi:hypothetical protein SDC9_150829 [bioreactor metagenome]|uniref:Uncharacterized protein n=1 Tax=bioreactor metagenome TaxID=1076179 RepID=A0A645ENK7_9ZZZZ
MPVYPEVTPDALHRCARQIAFYLKVLYSPAGVKKRFVQLVEKALGKDDFFSALAVSNAVNKTFYQEAKALFARMAGLEEKGALAVANLTEHIQINAPLSDLFQKNFE